jgi:hypothetical protein
VPSDVNCVPAHQIAALPKKLRAIELRMKKKSAPKHSLLEDVSCRLVRVPLFSSRYYLCNRSRDSYGLDGPVSTPHSVRFFSSPQPPIQWVPNGLFPRG